MIPIDKLMGRLGNKMFMFAYIYSKYLDGEIPDVYVQDYKLWSKHRDKIKQLYGSDISNINQVAIHVRRGDYVKNSFYVDLMETDYYENAMNEFRGDEFLVFSDDIEWCKKQPIFSGCEFSTGNEIDDMNLFASCKGHIIANSSWSWWGAFLGKGKVIAPLKWYSDGEERTIIPKEWKRI